MKSPSLFYSYINPGLQSQTNKARICPLILDILCEISSGMIIL